MQWIGSGSIGSLHLSPTWATVFGSQPFPSSLPHCLLNLQMWPQSQLLPGCHGFSSAYSQACW
jgi:hypothetical protein